MRATSTERSPRSLLAELLHHGGVTVMTSDRAAIEQGDRVDLVTVIQIDGTVITHVSEELLGTARLRRIFREHMRRVSHAVEPLALLKRELDTARRRLAIVGGFVGVAMLGLPKALHVDRWVTAHLGLGPWIQLGLLGLGSVAGATGLVYYRDRVKAWLGRLAARALLAWLRFFAKRALSG